MLALDIRAKAFDPRTWFLFGHGEPTENDYKIGENDLPHWTMTKQGNIAVKLCPNEVGVRRRDCKSFKSLGECDLRCRHGHPSLHGRITRYEPKNYLN